jgi:hypothetical protein
MKDKKIVGVVVIGLLVAGISFWSGMTYAGNNLKKANANRQGTFSQNGFGGQNGGVRGSGMMRGGAGGGLVSGKVLSVDANSMTVALGNGGPQGTQSGSKIVLFSSTTKIEKTVDGAVADVVVGKQVMITGTANPDGSVSATSVQIRPNQPAAPTKTN